MMPSDFVSGGLPAGSCDPRREKRRRGLTAALALVAVLVGAALRFLQISDQIIADDEWHSLHMLLDHGYGYIFTHFGTSDYCIPLTLYDKLVADTIGLSEWSMRAPMLCAGVAALILIPWLLHDHLGAKATLVFAWLLAISPLHVYFSRYARPYSLVFLLVVVGTLAFARWLSSGKQSWALVFALCAILAAWFHLAYLPFTIAPFACVFVLGFQRSRRERGARLPALWRALPRGYWILAATVIGGLCALLVPPILNDWTAIAMRSGHRRFDLPPPLQIYDLLSGAQLPLLAFASGIAFLLGLVAMLEKARTLLVCFVIVLGVQIGALAISGPDELDTGIVLVRYALPILAVFLWILAMGFVRLDALIRKQWKRAPAHSASVCMCIALPLWGPLRQAYRSPNNWTNHAMYQLDYAPDFGRRYASMVIGLQAIPPIYAQIGQLEDSDFRIVEAPWNYVWSRIPYPIYQRSHQKQTLIGFVDDPLLPPGVGELPMGDPRFHFDKFVHVSDFDSLRRKQVRFVILHRDVAASTLPGQAPRTAAVERWRQLYIEQVGEPVFESESLSVFELTPTR